MPEEGGPPEGTGRLFLALAPPERLRRPLAELAAALPCGAWDLEPVDPADYHLTLHFLGATPLRLVDDLRRELGALCHARRPFDLRAGGLGCFPDDGAPRVVWAGVRDPAGRLAELFDATRRVLDRYRLFRLDREPAPHLTLARVARLSSAWDPRWLRGLAPSWGDLGPFGVERVLLMRSRGPAEGGPRHEVLASLGLGGQGGPP